MFAKLRAWLVLTRGSNLPTVWSNLTVGWAISFVFAESIPPFFWLLGGLLGLWIGVSFTYVGGMILNDAFDAEWDRERRSGRPIASGLVSVRAAYAAGFLGLLLGVFFTSVSAAQGHGRPVFVLSLVLTGLVLVYDRWHKGVAWAPVVMGLCRALLPVIGFFSGGGLVDDPSCHGLGLLRLLAHPVVLCMLTLSVTIVARHEAGPGRPPRWAEWLMYALPAPFLLLHPLLGWAFLGCAGYWLWIWFSNRRHPLPAGVAGRVSDRLAAFPLIDFIGHGLFLYFAAPLAHSGSSSQGFWIGFASLLACFLPPVCFGLTLLLRRWIPQT